MHTAIVMVAFALAAAPVQAPDTVFSVERGTRLEVDSFRGEVVVRGWDRDAVRVRSDLSDAQALDIVRAGAAVRIRPRRFRGGPGDAELEIEVPRWMDLRIEGNQLDVEVSGVEGEVSIETVDGDIDVEGGTGLLGLRSIQGEIHVRGARGRIEAVSVNEDVTLTRVEGELYVESTNGDITMREMRSGAVRATTMNGDLLYAGTIQENGRYVLSTHNGDVTMTVPEGASATVSVSTYHGEFESEFPVRLTGTTQDRQFTFTLGRGSARLELESFNGEILLRRPR